MQLEEPSTKNEEVIHLVVPKNLMRRPFPLIWGLVAMALFLGFAAVTIYQFNRINADKIQDAQMKTYESDVRAYETAVKAHDDCLMTIDVRETYRKIFAGIEVMFQSTADYPAAQFPNSEFAQQYQNDLTNDINKYITQPVANGLPPKKVADCPKIPEKEPVKPDQ